MKKPNPSSLMIEMRNQLRMLEDINPLETSEMEFTNACIDMRQMLKAYEDTIHFAYDLLRDGDE